MKKSHRKLVKDNKLKEIVATHKKQNKKIVLTSGSWDILHVGHMRYLESAKKLGDILIVGIDSDTKIRKRKGEGRPIVPEDERIEMLCHLEYVDVVYLKSVNDVSNGLIKIVNPDILVTSKTTGHSDKKFLEKQKLCGEIVILDGQAETSTTARIRILHVDGQKKLADQLIEAIPRLIKETLGSV